MRRSPPLRWLVVATLAACQGSDQLELDFGFKGSGLNGFFCLDAQQRPLIDRAAPAVPDGGLQPISLVFDVISLDGGPDCATTDLVNWCQGGNCVISDRQCVPLPMQPLQDVYNSGDAGSQGAVRGALLAGIEQLSATPLISGLTTTQDVIVRMVGTLTSCDALGPGFDAGLLVGCAYTCPQPIGVSSGSPTVVQIGFNVDPVGPCALGDVIFCATTALP